MGGIKQEDIEQEKTEQGAPVQRPIKQEEVKQEKIKQEKIEMAGNQSAAQPSSIGSAADQELLSTGKAQTPTTAQTSPAPASTETDTTALTEVEERIAPFMQNLINLAMSQQLHYRDHLQDYTNKLKAEDQYYLQLMASPLNELMASLDNEPAVVVDGVQARISAGTQQFLKHQRELRSLHNSFLVGIAELMKKTASKSDKK